MSLVTIARGPHDGRPRATFRLGTEFGQLEDRCVPATLASTSSPTLLNGLDAPAIVLGSSENGQYLLIQSEATNFVDNQITAPGQTNLFWLDVAGNIRRLVSSFEPPLGSAFKIGTKGLGVAKSVPGISTNAVISDDGHSVAFISPANAGLFENQVPLSNDGGGNDMFVWRDTTQQVILASKDKRGQALGGNAQVSNPFISPDGATGAFVSTAVAQNVILGPTSTFDSTDTLYRDNIGTPDIFRFQLTQTPQPVSYDVVPTLVIYARDKFGNPLRQFENRYFMHGDVQVDPLNRYGTSGSSGFVGIRRNTGTAGAGFDAWRYSYNPLNEPPSFANANNNIHPATSAPLYIDINGNKTPGKSGLGNVGNVIIGSISGEALFTYQVRGTGGKGSMITGYLNQNGGDYDLYRQRFTENGPTVDLVSAEANSTTKGGNKALDLAPGGYQITSDGTKAVFTSLSTNLAAGVTDINNAFDVFQRNLQPGTVNNTTAVSVNYNNPNLTGNGASRFPVQTPDALAIGYESVASNLSNVPDTNGATDVFVRDVLRGDTLMASTKLRNAGAGNGRSFGIVVVRTTNIYPDRYYREFQAFFSSDANDLDPKQTVTAGSQIYQQQFPVFISKLPRVFAYSGGNNGQAALAGLDDNGKIITGGTYQPFGPNYTGEVRVAYGDVNGDGVNDLIAGAGPGGGPRVVVIDGFNGRTLDDFFAYEPSFTGGVYVAAADMNGDGKADVIVGAGEGGAPRFSIYNSNTGIVMADTFAFEQGARTGVRVGTTDFNADGIPDLIVSAGNGGGPRVRVFDGKSLPSLNELANFFAFESTQRGGAYVSGGDANGDGKGDIAVGGGPDGGPRVRIFDSTNINKQDPNAQTILADFFAGDPNSRDGARVLLRDVDGDKIADLVVSTGAGLPVIRTYIGGSNAGNGGPLQADEIRPFGALTGLTGAWVG